MTLEDKKDKKPQAGRHKKSSNMLVQNNVQRFKGKIKELESWIFDAYRFNQADKYMRTLQEILEYIGTNFDGGGDVKMTLESEEAL